MKKRFNAIIKWLDNYWYHNKWQTIMGAAAVIIIGVLVVQMANKDEFDNSVIYAGPVQLSPNQVREVEKALSDAVIEDMNGDGKKTTQLYDFFIMTDEQKEEAQRIHAENGELYAVNVQEMQNARNGFTTHVFTGETMICLLDPSLYELLREQDAFSELSAISDTVGDGIDGYGVRLCDTPFARKNSIMSIFPADTVLCFRRVSTASFLGDRKKDAERYNRNLEIFKAMIEG